MSFRKNLIANTTAYKQNCLLNCATHKIIEVWLATASNSLDENHPFNLIKDSFNEYYGFSEKNNDEKSLADILQLFQKIKNPLDREYILGPVLRQCLITAIDKHHGDHLLEDASSGFKKVIADILELGGGTPDYLQDADNIKNCSNPNLALSNRSFIEEIYPAYIKWKEIDATGSIAVFFESKPEKDGKTIIERIKEYWKNNGFANYQRELAKDIELTAFEANLLLQKLGIAIIDYSNPLNPQTYDLISSLPVYPTLKLRLEDQHWQYLEADEESAVKHNAHYMRDREQVEYYTYAEGGNYLSQLQDVIKKNKTDASGIQKGITERIKEAFAELLVTHEAKKTPVSAPLLQTHVSSKPSSESKEAFMTDPNRKDSFEEERWAHIANNSRQQASQPIVDFSEDSNNSFDLKEPPVTTPSPPVKQQLLSQKQQPQALSVRQPVATSNIKDICAISKMLDEKLAQEYITVDRSKPEVVTYKQLQKAPDGSDTAILGIKADKIVCEKTNDFATRILVEYLVELAVAGHRNIVIEGGPEGYSKTLMQKAKEATDKQLKNLPPQERDTLFISGPEKTVVTPPGYRKS